jgi:chorismate synthase
VLADHALRHRAQNADVACGTPRIPGSAVAGGAAAQGAMLEDPDPEEA